MKKYVLFLALLPFYFSSNAQLVISEIFYDAPNPGNDSLEFVEFYNNGTAAVNLNGYYFKNAFRDTLPNVNLQPKTYYVVASNAAYFKSKFGRDCRQWRTGDALNNSGELIELWTNTNVLADSVRYSSRIPWPTAPNGSGASAVLCNANDDNNNPANWSTCLVPSTAKINNITLFVTPFEDNCKAGDIVVANNDAVNTTVNKKLTIGVLKNDISTKPVTISGTTNPGKGTISINSSKDSIVYTPNKDYCGVDDFTYSITDGTLQSTATVAVTISGCSSAGSIKDAKTVGSNGVLANLNNIFELNGVVNSINFRPDGLEFVIVDAAGDGIGIFHASKKFGYTVKEGDKIRVGGKLAQFNGYAQISPDTLFKTGTGAVETPKVVTKIDESTESQIITLKNVTLVDATKWVAAGTGFNVEVTDGTNKTVVRIDKDTDIFGTTAPKGRFDISGVGYQFDSSLPYTEGYQLYPRYLKDIKLIVNTQDEELGRSIEIYPNPLNDRLTVNVEEKLDKLSITDIMGHVVYLATNISYAHVINTSHFSSGVYFVTVSKNNRYFTTRVVKN
ncbi:MAG: lamin tail domain-containing protein [Saprospiraceae bacterium]